MWPIIHDDFKQEHIFWDLDLNETLRCWTNFVGFFSFFLMLPTKALASYSKNCQGSIYLVYLEL